MKFQNTIAIGDIHGQADLLNCLLDTLEDRFGPTNTRFVLLGDLIDRGPSSADVISRACRLFETFPGSIFILGNHEEYFLDFMHGMLGWNGLQAWMDNGGRQTLLSYGFDAHDDDSLVYQWLFKNRRDHLDLLQNARSMEVMGRYCFVHAGIDPTISLDRQAERQTRWIREGFLDYAGQTEKIVVHGHSITPSKFPEVHGNRIAIDTGSYATGRIAAAIFESEELSGFVCAEREQEEIKCTYFDVLMRPLDSHLALAP